MITIETDRTPGAAQTITAEVLGYIHGVSVAGRLGVQIDLSSLTVAEEDALVSALSAGGHAAVVTRDLDAAARRARAVDTAGRDAREQLYAAIQAAVAGGMTKVEASRRAGVSRVTIDRVLKV